MKKPNSRFWWWTGYAGVLMVVAGFIVCNVVYSGRESSSRFKVNPDYVAQATVVPATRHPPTIMPTRRLPPSPTLEVRVIDRDHLGCQSVEVFKAHLRVDQRALGKETRDLEVPLGDAARSPGLLLSEAWRSDLETELDDVERLAYVWENVLVPSVLDDEVEGRMNMIGNLIGAYTDAVRSLVDDFEEDPSMGEYLDNIVWNVEEIHKIVDDHLAKCG